MIKLQPMAAADFKPFMEISMRDHASGQIQSGRWPADEAEANIQKLRAQFLPKGLDTPDHHFFTLENEADEKVGAIWYWVTTQDGQPLIFVVDIQVFPEYRRRGYGSQAFLAMEKNAIDLGIDTIAMSVFQHNHNARAMYEKLGYLGTGEALMKKLQPTVGG